MLEKRNYIGRKYTSTVSGSIRKDVRCAYCNHEFDYLMKREAKGEAVSWFWLNNFGASNNHKLRYEIDAVSCPECGKYQEKMVTKLKVDAWYRVGKTILLFGLVGGFLIFAGFNIFKIIPAWLVILLTIFVWLWPVLLETPNAITLDPNNSVKRNKGKVKDIYPMHRLWPVLSGLIAMGISAIIVATFNLNDFISYPSSIPALTATYQSRIQPLLTATPSVPVRFLQK